MADAPKPKDRRSPPSLSSARAAAGSAAAPKADWGKRPAKGGIRGEVKLALMLVMTLASAFGYIVYRKFDHLQSLAAAEVGTEKFEPIDAKDSAAKEVKLFAPEQSAEPAFSPPEQTEEPVWSTPAASTRSTATSLSALPHQNSAAGEPAPFVQPATMVAAVRDASPQGPWAAEPSTSRAASEPAPDLFRPEGFESGSTAHTPATAAPSFPQSEPPAQSEPPFTEPATMSTGTTVASAPGSSWTDTTSPLFAPAQSSIEPAVPAFDSSASSSGTASTSVTANASTLSSPAGISSEPAASFSPRVAQATPAGEPAWAPPEQSPASDPFAPASTPAQAASSSRLTQPVATNSSSPWGTESTASSLSASPLAASTSGSSSFASSSTSSAFGSSAGGSSSPAFSNPRSDNEQRYTVRPGDNYWSISRTMYGTTKYFEALIEYNRAEVPDPERLQPGTPLAIPPREFLEAHFPQLSGRFAPGGAKTGSATPGVFTVEHGQPTYRVGQGDTLTSIAQKHLGRASRWQQIYEMNLDVLPSPDTLKPGTILKLPQDASQVAATPDAGAIR